MSDHYKERMYSSKPSKSAKLSNTTESSTMPSMQIDESIQNGKFAVVPRGTITSVSFGGSTFELLNSDTLRELEKAFGKQDHRVKLCTDALRQNAKVIAEMQQRVTALEAKIQAMETTIESLRNFGLYGNTDQSGEF